MVPLLTSDKYCESFCDKKTITKKGDSKDVAEEKLVTKIMFKTKN